MRTVSINKHLNIRIMRRRAFERLTVRDRDASLLTNSEKNGHVLLPQQNKPQNLLLFAAMAEHVSPTENLAGTQQGTCVQHSNAYQQFRKSMVGKLGDSIS